MIVHISAQHATGMEHPLPAQSMSSVGAAFFPSDALFAGEAATFTFPGEAAAFGEAPTFAGEAFFSGSTGASDSAGGGNARFTPLPPPRPRPPPRPPPRPEASRHFSWRALSRSTRIFSISLSSAVCAFCSCFACNSLSFFTSLMSTPTSPSVRANVVDFPLCSASAAFLASKASFSFCLASSTARLAVAAASLAAFFASSSSLYISRPASSASRMLIIFVASTRFSWAFCNPRAASSLAMRAALSFSTAKDSFFVAASTSADLSVISCLAS
mmetsp:Transcript_17904/g.38073  ORF Transcript_17904/g.38073 Transcript_17904/m.38073 type:complete len:272 (-) Transcript_17904:478-1293(-)